MGLSNSTIIRLKLCNSSGVLSTALNAIGELEATVGAIDIITADNNYIVRDITIGTRDAEQTQKVIDTLSALDDIEVVNYSDRTFLLHLGGKIETKSASPCQGYLAIPVLL